MERNNNERMGIGDIEDEDSSWRSFASGFYLICSGSGETMSEWHSFGLDSIYFLCSITCMFIMHD